MAEKTINGVKLKCSFKECGVSWINQLSMTKKGALEKMDVATEVGCPYCGRPASFMLAKLWAEQGFPQWTKAPCNCNGCGGASRWVKVA